MKRFVPIVVFLALLAPAMMFAQDRQTRESRVLQQAGLTGSQITQVTELQNTLRNTIRQDVAYLKLLRAQIDVALLPANPDMQKVNDLIDQSATRRADMQKAAVAARVQLRSIVGENNVRRIEQLLRQSWREDRNDRPRQRPMPGPGPVARPQLGNPGMAQ
ncbi:MAG TPA: hypothetical protein VMW73_17820 [Spirochaetia bacterium]|nr:hypothetical protein [Spirochaetia bacterium]